MMNNKIRRFKMLKDILMNFNKCLFLQKEEVDNFLLKEVVKYFQEHFI